MLDVSGKSLSVFSSSVVKYNLEFYCFHFNSLLVKLSKLFKKPIYWPHIHRLFSFIIIIYSYTHRTWWMRIKFKGLESFRWMQIWWIFPRHFCPTYCAIGICYSALKYIWIKQMRQPTSCLSHNLTRVLKESFQFLNTRTLSSAVTLKVHNLILFFFFFFNVLFASYSSWAKDKSLKNRCFQTAVAF